MGDHTTWFALDNLLYACPDMIINSPFHDQSCPVWITKDMTALRAPPRSYDSKHLGRKLEFDSIRS